MMNKILKIVGVLCCIFLCTYFESFSQQITPGSLGYYNDALRFSRTSFGGSARFQGIAGAHTAVGGDISNLNGNPAGLAFFRRSEMSFSPSVLSGKTFTDYFDLNEQVSTTEDSKGNFNMANVGAVFSEAKEDFLPGAWRGGAIGVSLTRVNNFQNQFSYNAQNLNSSKTDFYVDQSNGIPEGDLQNLDLLEYEYQRAAYFAYLTNPFSAGSDQYFTYARDENEELFAPQQQETVETRGSQYQFSLSAAGNVDDKIYFGATLGVMLINYREDRNYSESFAGTNSFLDSFTETNRLNVTGTGINATVGMIFRPINAFRIGASVSTPTLYALNEEFNTTFASNLYAFDDPNVIDSYEESALPGNFNYRLRTPWRANVGAAFFFEKYGFISLDAEYVDYESMSLRNSEFAGVFDADNNTIELLYKPVWNIRAGGELRYDIFRVRGGYALEGDPYDGLSDGLSRKISSITGGLGVRMLDWYADLAVVHARTNQAYQPYSFDTSSIYAGLEPFTEINRRNTRIVISMGVFF